MSTLQETSENLLAFCGDKRYSTIYADPPWRFQNRTGKVAPENKKLNRYETMPLEDIIVLARPQAGTKLSNEKRNGIEAMVALDISNSMLAEDVAPSRLDKSKMLIENMIDGFKNDKVGLVVFAGSSFVQLPITTDFVSAKMFLQSLSPSLIATQGTDIGGAINTCLGSFTKKENVGRAIIVITDGEDHEGGALEAAQKAKKSGVNVFVLGIGLPKGGLIPDGHGGYMKDNHGNEVMSVLNEDMCKQIAQAGGGAYIHVDIELGVGKASAGRTLQCRIQRV